MPDEIPVFEDKAKLQAMSAPDTAIIEGVQFYPFSVMRKALLQMTGNELMEMDKHIKTYCSANGIDPQAIPQDELENVILQAVPESPFHLTSLAYICTHSPKELADVTKTKENFRTTVYEWWDELGDKWQAVVANALVEFTRSNVANDYVIAKEKGGAPAPKN
jgi:hypothetical protein